MDTGCVIQVNVEAEMFDLYRSMGNLTASFYACVTIDANAVRMGYFGIL